jgi:hypothetical protein
MDGYHPRKLHCYVLPTLEVCMLTIKCTAWMDGWMDGWDGWMDGWMDGWTDGWTDGRMDITLESFIVMCYRP